MSSSFATLTNIRKNSAHRLEQHSSADIDLQNECPAFPLIELDPNGVTAVGSVDARLAALRDDRCLYDVAHSEADSAR